MQNEKFDNLFIVASGLGTRMHEYTLTNSIPKLLVSMGNSTILEHMLHDATNVANNIFVICNSKHQNMLKEHCILKNTVMPQFISYDFADGTANTIMSVLKSNAKLTGSTLFVWSDIICAKTKNLLPLLKLNAFNTKRRLQCNIALDTNRRHRFIVNKGNIMHAANMSGNVVGTYAINDIALFVDRFRQSYYDDVYANTSDFVELIKTGINNADIGLNTTTLKFIDVGDSAKYTEYMQSQNIKQRFFNNIEFTDNSVIKSNTNDQGYKLLVDEYLFYSNMSDKLPNMFVNVIDYYEQDYTAYLTLERLKCTVNEYVEANNIQPKTMFDKFVEFIKPLHSITSSRICNADKRNALIDEYYSTTVQRYVSINYLLATTHNMTFNGTKLKPFESIMKAFKMWLTNYKTTFAAIHGDPNTANVMLDHNDNLKLIDPRGYFGKIKIFGDVNYDYAKFLYGLTGYTQFNDDKFFNISNTNDFELKSYIKNLDDIVDDSQIEIKLLVGLIWLKLPAYISNNPLKSMYAYNYGRYLMQRYLTKLGYLEY